MLNDAPLREVYEEAKSQVYQKLAERPKTVRLSEDERKRLSEKLPLCVAHILTKLPAKSEKTNFNKLVMSLVTYFQMAGWNEQEAWARVQPFIEKYPYSETYDTPTKRTAHWGSEWNYLLNHSDYDFSCSYIKGLGLSGNGFDCSKCIESKTDELDEERAAIMEEGAAPDEKKDIEIAKPGIEPFTPDHTRVAGVLIEKPLEPEYLIKFKDKGLITRGIVAQLAAAGGTGKTQLVLQLAIACAAGDKFAYFSVDKPLSVLLLNAEETQDELDRRLWNACNGQFPPTLFARSIKGLIGPLMYLDGNEPKQSEWWN